MAIAIPGRRLALHCKPSFVTKLFARQARRTLNATLSLTSMIDFLIVVVVFLLMTFAASGRTSAAEVPAAFNVDDLLEAPVVSVTRGQVILDGVVLGNTHAIELSGRVAVLDGLTDALTAKRRMWTQLNPTRPPPGAVALDMDQDTPAVVVKSVFLTCTRAGYPDISLLVRAARP